MQVRDLDDRLVPGYRTQSAAGHYAWAAGHPLSLEAHTGRCRAGNE